VTPELIIIKNKMKIKSIFMYPNHTRGFWDIF
jgi:hypothetical protein